MNPAMSGSAARYMEQGTLQSLREGLAEYYERNPGLLAPSELPPAAAELFRQHDAGHVVFGCDTSLRGETLIDTWTVLGSTAGVRGYLQYFKLPQVNAIFAETGYGRIALESLRCLPDVARVLARSRRLTRRWPWAGYERYLDRPLADLRREFNIRVV
jgi:ubiquinone biosynthesis protein Coq4